MLSTLRKNQSKEDEINERLDREQYFGEMQDGRTQSAIRAKRLREEAINRNEHVQKKPIGETRLMTRAIHWLPNLRCIQCDKDTPTRWCAGCNYGYCHPCMPWPETTVCDDCEEIRNTSNDFNFENEMERRGCKINFSISDDCYMSMGCKIKGIRIPCTNCYREGPSITNNRYCYECQKVFCYNCVDAVTAMCFGCIGEDVINSWITEPMEATRKGIVKGITEARYRTAMEQENYPPEVVREQMKLYHKLGKRTKDHYGKGEKQPSGSQAYKAKMKRGAQGKDKSSQSNTGVFYYNPEEGKAPTEDEMLRLKKIGLTPIARKEVTNSMSSSSSSSSGNSMETHTGMTATFHNPRTANLLKKGSPLEDLKRLGYEIQSVQARTELMNNLKNAPDISTGAELLSDLVETPDLRFEDGQLDTKKVLNIMHQFRNQTIEKYQNGDPGQEPEAIKAVLKEARYVLSKDNPQITQDMRDQFAQSQEEHALKLIENAGPGPYTLADHTLVYLGESVCCTDCQTQGCQNYSCCYDCGKPFCNNCIRFSLGLCKGCITISSEIEAYRVLRPQKDENGNPAEQLWCPYCEMWLRDQTQMDDHKIGRKHRKNVRKMQGDIPMGCHQCSFRNSLVRKYCFECGKIYCRTCHKSKSGRCPSCIFNNHPDYIDDDQQTIMPEFTDDDEDLKCSIFWSNMSHEDKRQFVRDHKNQNKCVTCYVEGNHDECDGCGRMACADCIMPEIKKCNECQPPTNKIITWEGNRDCMSCGNAQRYKDYCVGCEYFHCSECIENVTWLCHDCLKVLLTREGVTNWYELKEGMVNNPIIYPDTRSGCSICISEVRSKFCRKCQALHCRACVNITTGLCVKCDHRGRGPVRTYEHTRPYYENKQDARHTILVQGYRGRVQANILAMMTRDAQRSWEDKILGPTSKTRMPRELTTEKCSAKMDSILNAPRKAIKGRRGKKKVQIKLYHKPLETIQEHEPAPETDHPNPPPSYSPEFKDCSETLRKRCRALDIDSTGEVPLDLALDIVHQLSYVGAMEKTIRWEPIGIHMEDLLRKAGLVYTGANGTEQIRYESLISYIKHSVSMGSSTIPRSNEATYEYPDDPLLDLDVPELLTDREIKERAIKPQMKNREGADVKYHTPRADIGQLTSQEKWEALEGERENNLTKRSNQKNEAGKPGRLANNKGNKTENIAKTCQIRLTAQGQNAKAFRIRKEIALLKMDQEAQIKASKISAELLFSPTTQKCRTLPCGLNLIGKDDRGWLVIDVDANDNAKIYNVTLNGKYVSFVSQKQLMRVYVDPSPTAFDEWEIGGQRFLVAPPLEHETMVTTPPDNTEWETESIVCETPAEIARNEIAALRAEQEVHLLKANAIKAAQTKAKGHSHTEPCKVCNEDVKQLQCLICEQCSARVCNDCISPDLIKVCKPCHAEKLRTAIILAATDEGRNKAKTAVHEGEMAYATVEAHSKRVQAAFRKAISLKKDNNSGSSSSSQLPPSDEDREKSLATKIEQIERLKGLMEITKKPRSLPPNIEDRAIYEAALAESNRLVAEIEDNIGESESVTRKDMQDNIELKEKFVQNLHSAVHYIAERPATLDQLKSAIGYPQEETGEYNRIERIVRESRLESIRQLHSDQHEERGFGKYDTSIDGKYTMMTILEDENMEGTNYDDYQNSQRVTPTKVALCNWCVDPGINQCEGCQGKVPKGLFGHLMCIRCDTFLVHCRLCRLEDQREKDKAHVTPHRKRHRGIKGEDTCFTCGKRGRLLKHCTGCGVAKYCGEECQRNGWQDHMQHCKIFKQNQPLKNVYPWSMERAYRATSEHKHLFTNVRNY